jgi:hypothetical protein
VKEFFKISTNPKIHQKFFCIQAAFVYSLNNFLLKDPTLMAVI